VTKYYYFNGQRVAMRGSDEAVTWIHGDHLGSTSLTMDEGGQVVGRQLYAPFGEVRWASGALGTDFGFTGQRADAFAGLVHMGARWYNPLVGRWVSADTIVPEPGNPQDFNRYAYSRNNPLRFVDASGHRTCGPGANPLDETCDENMGNPDYGFDGPNAGDYTAPRGIWKQPEGEAVAAYCEAVGGCEFGLAPFEYRDGKLWFDEKYIGLSFEGGELGLPNPHWVTNIEGINDTLDLISLMSSEAELAVKLFAAPALVAAPADPPAVFAYVEALFLIAESLGLPADMITLTTEGPLSEEGLYWGAQEVGERAFGPYGATLFLITDVINFYNHVQNYFGEHR
jgi:RHS repeat-associated protein